MAVAFGSPRWVSGILIITFLLLRVSGVVMFELKYVGNEDNKAHVKKQAPSYLDSPNQIDTIGKGK